MIALKISSIFLVFRLIQVQCELSYAGDYGYDDENDVGVGTRNSLSNWGQISQNCSGFRQSPIDLDDSLINRMPLLVILQNFELKAEEVEMTNDGHTVELRLRYSEGRQATVSGPAVNNEFYIVHSIHFHWGENDNVGSEHTVNGNSYPGEIHIVSYNSRYRSVQEARKQPDGLAVIGTFIAVNFNNIPFELQSQYYLNQFGAQIGAQLGSQPSEYLAWLPNLIEPNATVRLTGRDSVSLLDVIKQNPASSYYTYRGSLTTPDCEESVIWFVNRLPVMVSSEVLQNFRNIKNRRGGRIKRNYRAVQHLNNRPIFRFF